MHKAKKLLGLLLALLLLVGYLPGTVEKAQAADDEFYYPKLSYSNGEGITNTILTMGGVQYLVYTITQDGALTVNGNYVADVWLAGGGADGEAITRTNPPAYGGGGGYTTTAVNMLLRSGDITIGPGGGGTTTYASDDPLNPGQQRTLSAAGGNGADGGSGGGKGGKGQGRTTRPFGALEMPAYCQGGWSSSYYATGFSTYPAIQPGSNGGDGADYFNGVYCYGRLVNGYGENYIPATGTDGVGGGVATDGGWSIVPGNNATAYGSGGSGGSTSGKGYQGVMMIRIPLSSLLPADYGTVDSAITWANSLPQDRYKDFSAVDAAIAAVQRDKVASEQDDVNTMAQAIMNAIHALESVGADYGVVNDLAAYAMSLNSAHYSNYNVVVEAFSAIDWDKSIEEQAAVNAMAQQLFAAINALIPLPADYAAVDAALAIIAGLPDPSYYVTFEGIRTAVSTVVRGKPKSQQSDVDAMAQTLIAAINSLQLYPADYRRVDQTILRAAELDASDYTNFDTVMTAARSVDRSKSILEQEEVDTMATTLMTAIDNLELVGADYTGVDTAIRYAQGLDPRDYTNFAALSEAIRAVDRSKTINEQAQVDQMAADIVQAILTLQRVAVTPTPSTTNPTPTPYTGTPATSNGITLDQLKSLLNQNNTTSTTKTLSMPKTGAPYDATAIVVLVGCVCSLIVLGCVLYILYRKKHTFKNTEGEK